MVLISKAESLNDIIFINISAFTACFAFRFFYCFVQTEWPYRTKTVLILIVLSRYNRISLSSISVFIMFLQDMHDMQLQSSDILYSIVIL